MTNNKFHETKQSERRSDTVGALSKTKSVDYLSDKYKVFKPQDGVNVIRLLPRLIDDPHGDVYGFPFYQYYINGKYLCAPDAIDRNVRNPFFAKYQETWKVDQELARDYKGVQRRLVFVLVFSDETEGAQVQIWPAPISVITKITEQSRSIQDNGALVPVEDINDGRKIFIEKTGQGIKTEYRVELDKKACRISEEVADELCHYAELLNVPTPEECDDIIEHMHASVGDGVIAPTSTRPSEGVDTTRNERPRKSRFEVSDDDDGDNGGSVSAAISNVKERLGG